MSAPAAKHSSATAEWFTPRPLVERARAVLGPIDLDPASCAAANRVVLAYRFLSEHVDGLATPWIPGSVFLNPPSGMRGKMSLPLLFWKRLMEHRDRGLLTHAVFVAFSGELLQVSQGRERPGLTSFPLCVPKKRIRFVRPDGEPGPSPSHSNAIVYVPGTVDRSDVFASVFADVGAILVPR